MLFSQTQDEDFVREEERILNGSIRLSSTYIPENRFKDTSGYFSSLTEELNLRFPIFRGINKESGNYVAILGNLDGGYSQTRFTNSPVQPAFIRAAAGLDFLFHYRKKNTWIISAKVGFSEDQSTIAYAKYRRLGSIVYYRRSSEHFGFMLGTLTSNNYFNRQTFPIIGMVIKPNTRNTLSVIFPLSFDYQCRPIDKFSFGFRLAPKGEQGRLASPFLDSLNRPVILRMGHLDASMTLRIHPTNSLDIALQGGIMFGNKATFKTRDGQEFRNPLDRGAFYKISLYYRFGGKKKEQNKDKENDDETDQILDQLNIDDISNY